MKKILCFILVIVSLFSVYSCSDDKDYEPIESTEKEAAAVIKFKIDGDEYEVRYELYRALFLTYATDYDKGDKSFWNSSEADNAKKEINDKIISFSSDIYATLHHAKQLGLDPYSKDVDEKIYQNIESSIDGNDDAAIEGFGGDYDAYLQSLYDMNLNYSVQVLLLRYSIAYNSIVSYYTGNVDDESPTPDMVSGKLEYNKEDVYEFYMSEDAVRVSVIEMNPLYISESRINEIRDKIASFTNMEDALNYAIGNTASDASDIKNGVIIGTQSLDIAYYNDLIDAAFSLELHETSEPIQVYSNEKSVFWILYKQSKSDAHFNEFYDDIENVYISQKIGEFLYGVKTSMEDSKEFTDIFDNLNYSSISMDDK